MGRRAGAPRPTVGRRHPWQVGTQPPASPTAARAFSGQRRPFGRREAARTHPPAAVDSGNKTSPTAVSSGPPRRRGWPRNRSARLAPAWLQSKERYLSVPPPAPQPGLERTRRSPPLKPPPRAFSHGGDWSEGRAAPSQAASPRAGHLRDSCAPSPAPIPNSFSSRLSGASGASAAPRPPQPGPATVPRHLCGQQSRPGRLRAPQARREGPAELVTSRAYLGAPRAWKAGAGPPPVGTRARLQEGGARRGGACRTREVTREVARCLAVCLQRAPPLSTRLYNLTHNWP